MRGHGIAKRMLWAYVGIVLGAVLLFSATVGVLLMYNLRGENEYQAEAKLAAAARLVGNQLSTCENGLQSLAFNSVLLDFLSHPYETSEDIEFYLENIGNITNLFNVAGIMVSDFGEQYTVYQQNEMPENVPYIVSSQRLSGFEFLDELLLAGDDRNQNTRVFVESGTLYMFKPVLGIRDKTFWGYVAFHSPLEQFFSPLADILQENEGISVSLAGGGAGDIYSVGNGGGQGTMTAAEGNALFSITLHYDFYGNAKRTAALLGIFLLFAFVLFCILAWYLYRFIRSAAKRIENVSEKVRLIAAGNFDVKVQDDAGTDEIGDLGRGINVMTENINRLIEENYRKKLKMQQTEFELLQNQIKPHFLYNTFSMLRWKAEETGAEQLSEIIQNLARFYRATLSDGRSTISVREELEIITGYLYIQNSMHDGRLRYTVDVEEEVLSKNIPKLSLQPLVENAIEHGLLPLRADRPAEIRITGHIRGGAAVLEVTDNGKGIPAGEIDTIIKKQSKGIGLKNIDAQIKNQFGEGYGLSVCSVCGEYTTVFIRLPA